MNNQTETKMKNVKLNEEMSKACFRIAPAWSLENIVAVNPYLGLSDLRFNAAAQVLYERSGIHMGMPKKYYIDKIENKKILDIDINFALQKNNELKSSTAEFLKEAKFLAVLSEAHVKFKAKTITDITELLTNKHWNDFMIERISTWASAHFDKSQALWKTSSFSEDLFLSWKQDAEVDYSTELMGIRDFRSILKEIPNDSIEAADFVVRTLNISPVIQETYFHTLLLKVVGWASFIRGKDWDNSLVGNNTTLLNSFMSILLCWEYCLHESFEKEGVQPAWMDSKAELANRSKSPKIDEYLKTRMILQDAYDFSCQRQLTEKFNNHKAKAKLTTRPKVQAVFCIDVRSEVYRRNLEKVDPNFETIGFAGFFGFSINFKPIAHDTGHNLCPALIPADAKVKEILANDEQTDQAIRKRVVNNQVSRIWKYFKSGAISGFSFVSPLGLSYLPKILSDSYGLTRPVNNPKIDGLKDLKNGARDLDLSDIPFNQKVEMAKGAITSMGLKDNMAQLILITGHGSSSVNNPHASSYDCGACGGHSGEINAMTAERILNDVSVRTFLKKDGIEIPDDTHFSACLHDTTTDEITIMDEQNIPSKYGEILRSVKASLKSASSQARMERSFRLGINGKNIDAAVMKRNNDWAQVRPEWGLAGCNSFIIAPRHRTKGMNLGGKSFLQSYDWKVDPEFKILESIMTAPMVVTSWINLQYYASTVDNKRFGSGNKTLHNITAGIGVLEGATGDLRIGLPIQSVHDGIDLQHLPHRINVLIEAPAAAINQVLNNHPNIKELCDNSWITLLNVNENGKVIRRYNGDLKWTPIEYSQKENDQLVTL